MLPAPQSHIEKPKRGRGRPPGSKNKLKPKKTAATTLCELKTTPASVSSTNDVSNAMKFLPLIKESTAEQPYLLDAFTSCLENYRCKRINIDTLYREITSTFYAYPDLIARFKHYFHEESVGMKVTNLTALGITTCTERLPCNRLTKNQLENLTTSSAVETSQASVQPLWVPNVLPYYDNSEPQQVVPVSISATKTLQSDMCKTQSLHGTPLLIVNLHQFLKNRFGKTPEKYDIVSCALLELIDMIRTDAKNIEIRESIAERCNRAYEVIHAVLKEEPDLMNLVNAFLNFERMQRDISSASSHLVADSLADGTRLYQSNFSINCQNGGPEILLQPLTEVCVNAHPSQIEILVTLISRLQESVAFKGILSATLYQHSAIRTEDSLLRIKNALIELLLSQYDGEKWIIQLVYTLWPVLMRLTSLRNYIINNLGVLLMALDDGSKEAESKRVVPGHLSPNPNLNSSASEPCQNVCDDLGVETNDSDSKTYNKYSRGDAVIPLCSGRTQLCNQVLNDEYYSVYPGKKYKIYTRSEEELRLDDYEDSRYEVDMILHRNARTIEVLQDLNRKMSNMTADKLNIFQLDDYLGGSSVVHKCTIQLLYNVNGALVIEGLKKFPTIFVPHVLQLLQVRDKEWIEFRARWNRVISSELKKFVDKCRRKNRVARLKYIVPRTRRSM